MRVSRANGRGRWIKRARNKKSTKTRSRERAWRGGEDIVALPFLTEQVHASISAVADGECFVRSRSEIATFHRRCPPSLPLPRDLVLVLLVPSDPSLARAPALATYSRRVATHPRALRRGASPPRRFHRAKLHNASNPTSNRLVKPISIPESDSFSHSRAQDRVRDGFSFRVRKARAATLDFKYSRDFLASPSLPPRTRTRR